MKDNENVHHPSRPLSPESTRPKIKQDGMTKYEIVHNSIFKFVKEIALKIHTVFPFRFSTFLYIISSHAFLYIFSSKLNKLISNRFGHVRLDKTLKQISSFCFIIYIKTN
jgi:hypothetical protein